MGIVVKYYLKQFDVFDNFQCIQCSHIFKIITIISIIEMVGEMHEHRSNRILVNLPPMAVHIYTNYDWIIIATGEKSSASAG